MIFGVEIMGSEFMDFLRCLRQLAKWRDFTIGGISPMKFATMVHHVFFDCESPSNAIPPI